MSQAVYLLPLRCQVCLARFSLLMLSQQRKAESAPSDAAVLLHPLQAQLQALAKDMPSMLVAMLVHGDS